jgi:hypothetical protein
LKTKRQLLIAMTTAGVATAGLGATVLPASAVPRTFQVTLVTGQTVVVTVDVPPGTPVDQISFPGVSGPVASVTEITPAPEADPAPADVKVNPPAETTPSAPEVSDAPADGGASPQEEQAAQQAPQGGRDDQAQDGDDDPKRDRKDGAKESVRETTGGLYGEVPSTGGGTDREETTEERDARERRDPRSRYRAPDGQPTMANPTLSVADIGAAPSACRTSSSTSSASRRSCSRSTRRPASSTASAGRSWRRSTRSRPTTAAT